MYERCVSACNKKSLFLKATPIFDSNSLMSAIVGFFLGRFVFARFAYFTVNGAQYAVNKFARRVSSECFCKLNGFIDGHFRRYFVMVAEQQLINAKTEHRSVNNRYLIQWPLRRSLFNNAVNFLHMRNDAVDEVFDKFRMFYARSEFTDIVGNNLIQKRHVAPFKIPLV